MDDALDDIAKLGGIVSKKDYPYEAKDQTCALDAKKAVMTDTGSVLLPEGDEEKLKEIVATYGPVSVSIYATYDYAGYYKGIFQDELCTKEKDIGHQLNRGVLIVGYGMDEHHMKYWIVKDCLGQFWGEDGYIRIKRGVNMCGIALLPTIAKFD